MCEKNDSSTSSNAVNQLWSIEEARDLAEIDAPRFRAQQFHNELSEKLPDDEQTEMMLHIASAMAQMRNGSDSIWIYMGYPEEADNPPEQKPSHSVIERLGHAAIVKYRTSHRSPSVEEVIHEIAKLYRHSPARCSVAEKIPLRELEADIKGLLKRYEKI